MAFGPGPAAVVALFVGAFAGACAGLLPDAPDTAQPAPQASAVPAAYPVSGLVGKWGIASYRDEKDRVRTELKAHEQCKLPYAIAKGPGDGVMMHVADDEKLHELTLKTSADRKTYLGFDAPPGHEQDREILSWSDSRIVMRYVDPDVHTRYGIFIYVRCR